VVCFCCDWRDLPGGQLYALRAQVWLFERAPSEVSSTGGRRQRSGHVGGPRRGAPAPEAKPNVSRSSLLLCKFSSSALSRLTSGGSMCAPPLFLQLANEHCTRTLASYPHKEVIWQLLIAELSECLN
jgi:hypothetical protein